MKVSVFRKSLNLLTSGRTDGLHRNKSLKLPLNNLCFKSILINSISTKKVIGALCFQIIKYFACIFLLMNIFFINTTIQNPFFLLCHEFIPLSSLLIFYNLRGPLLRFVSFSFFR